VAVTPVFTLAGVNHWYDKPDAPVLRIDELAVPAGETVAVLGPSGCGKSTLLNLLGLLWEGGASKGDITYHRDGEAIPYADIKGKRARINQLRATDFGFVLQSCYLLPHFTGLENIAMPLLLRGVQRRAAFEAVDKLLEKVEARPVAKSAEEKTSAFRVAAGKKPREMSGGEKQRVAVLRSVVGGPRVVFADEPSSNLDAANTKVFLDLLADWRAGTFGGEPTTVRTLFLVCHHQETARHYGDRFILIGHDHRLRGVFPKADWPKWEGQIDRLLSPLPAEAT
jgi:ABC-type lipoprotein export system ATPase subunit